MPKTRVLLADRHKAMLEGIKYLLEPNYEIVGIVNDTKSLLEAADRLRPDIAIVDLSMPKSNDFNVARQLKNRNPDLKVIILSVHDEALVVRETLAAGALGFVFKWTAAEDLIPAIQNVLQGYTYVSPAVRGKDV